MVCDLRYFQSRIDTIQLKVDELKDAIKREMGADEVLRARTVYWYTVTYKPVTCVRFDSKAFQSTHAELYAQYSKPQAVRRFTVA
jgi:predicted phage-related endonuclease